MSNEAVPTTCPHCKGSDAVARNFLPGYFPANYRCENPWHKQKFDATEKRA